MNTRRLTAAMAAVVSSLGIVTVGAARASATSATSVTPGAVTVTPNTAGSNAGYTIPFKAASALGDGGTITFVAPTGTDFVSCVSCSGVYSIGVSNNDTASVAGAAATAANGSPTDNQLVLTLGAATIAPGDMVTVDTTDTTNPQVASTSYTIQESTSSDTTAVSSPGYAITASAAAAIAPTAGGGQSAEVGQPFPQALEATVTDAYGNPVAGSTVTFTAPANGPSGSFSASGCPSNTNSTPANECIVTSNASGLATAGTFTANSTASPSNTTYSVDATTPITTGTGTASFALTNTATPVKTITGGTVKLSSATEAASSVTYTVTFTSNDAIPSGGTITLTAPNGTTFPAGSGGTCGAAADVTSCTNPTVSYGTGATSVFVANAVASAAQGPGATTTSSTANSLLVTIGSTENLSGSPANSIPAGQAVTVTITGATNPTAASQSYVVAESDSADPTVVDTSDYAVLPGPATTLSIVAGTPQSATVGTTFSTPLQVIAKDANGNTERQGTAVTFVLTNTNGNPGGTFPGGTSTQQTNTTNTSGVATASPVSANHVSGSWSATAELPGAVSPQTFALTNKPGPAAQVLIDAGDNQSATVGTSYSTALKVTVEDQYGNTVPSATVTFTAPSSGPSGTFDAAGCPASTTAPAYECVVDTAADGTATAATFTANTKAGAFPVSAVAGTGSADFSETNTSGPAATITIVSGNDQNTVAGSAFSDPLVVAVTDADGNPVSGDQVTFTGPATGASGTFDPTGCAGNSASTPAYECIVTTDAHGDATSSTYTANGISGAQSVSANDTSNGVTTTAVDFALENLSAAPATLTPVAGTTPQTATVGTAFAHNLAVTVYDSEATPQPVADVYVTFTLNNPNGQSLGTFANGQTTDTVQSDGSGVAIATVFTASHTAWSNYTVTATAGKAAAGTFTLTNAPGPATAMVAPANDGTGQSAPAGTAYQNDLTAQVVDQYGNGVGGQPVSFKAPTTGPTGTFSAAGCTGNTQSTPAGTCIVSTAANGVATAPTFTAGGTLGNFPVSAASGTLTNSPLSYSLTITTGPVAKLVLKSGSGQSATVGTAFANPVVVEVTDAYGNPVQGAYVLFATPSSGASATFPGGTDQAAGTGSSDASGLVSSPAFTANHIAGAWQMSAEAYSCQGPCPVSGSTIKIGETNTADTVDATSFSVVSGTGQAAHIGQPFPHLLAVRIVDQFGNPVAGVSVTFSVPAGSPRGTFPFGASHATATSNAAGIATAPVLTANLIPGSWQATASATIGGTAKSAQFVLANTDGYWLVGSDGSLQSKGDATFDGSAAGQHLDAPVVGMAANPAGTGYWFLGADGGVFNYGAAPFRGSAYGKLGSATAVAIASTPSGQGYWVVGSNGSVFAFGDAKPYGNLTSVKLSKPIVGMAVTPDGKGYWMVGGDGGVFTFGDAVFYGSEGNQKLNAPVIGMAADPATGGYWLVASDGGVFTFHAIFYGSAGAAKLAAPVGGMAAAPSGQGYWLFGKDGGVFNYGPEAKFYGSGAGAGELVVGLAEG